MKVYLFDVPVYRLANEEYSRQLNEFVRSHIQNYDSEKLLLEAIKKKGSNEAKNKLNEASLLANEFGGGWRYNEVIGYIRIYKYGVQIRAEYWQVDSKRIVKTRRKKFTIKDRKLVPEIRVKSTEKGDGTMEAIDLCIEACKKKLKGRYLDLEAYYLVLKHVNWSSALKSV